jgi:hypothetical protein
MKIDLVKANACLDEYVTALSDPNGNPYRVQSRTWGEFCMKRHGFEVDSLPLWDRVALWFALLILTKRVCKISQLETIQLRLPRGLSTELAIKKHLYGHTSTVGQSLRRILNENGHTPNYEL